MNKSWTVNANGINHTIEYKRNQMIVDGEKYKLKSANPFIQMIDYSVNFGDVECRLVVVGRKVDRLYSTPGNVPNPVDMPDYCYFRDRCDQCTAKCDGAYPAEIRISPTHSVSCYLYEGEV